MCIRDSPHPDLTHAIVVIPAVVHKVDAIIDGGPDDPYALFFVLLHADVVAPQPDERYFLRIPTQTDQGVIPPCRSRATRDNFVVACGTLHGFNHPWRWYLANRRLSMRKIREVLRLAFGVGLALRKIERSMG